MKHYAIYDDVGRIISFGSAENVNPEIEISKEKYNELQLRSNELRKYTDMLVNGEIEAENVPDEYRETATRHAENILTQREQIANEISDSEALSIILGGDG